VNSGSQFYYKENILFLAIVSIMHITIIIIIIIIIIILVGRNYYLNTDCVYVNLSVHPQS